MTIREALPADRDLLLDIWLRSVRATHAFLAEADIELLVPVVREQVLPQLELWVLCSPNGVPMGFLGLSDSTVEALFVAPEWFRQGGGKRLLEHARLLKGSLSVDVNEQNPGALAFYLANGFEVVGRSPLDGQGKPFPILHLREVPHGPSR